jgi:hypothetical protein
MISGKGQTIAAAQRLAFAIQATQFFPPHS